MTERVSTAPPWRVRIDPSTLWSTTSFSIAPGAAGSAAGSASIQTDVGASCRPSTESATASPAGVSVPGSAVQPVSLTGRKRAAKDDVAAADEKPVEHQLCSAAAREHPLDGRIADSRGREPDDRPLPRPRPDEERPDRRCGRAYVRHRGVGTRVADRHGAGAVRAGQRGVETGTAGHDGLRRDSVRRTDDQRAVVWPRADRRRETVLIRDLERAIGRAGDAKLAHLGPSRDVGWHGRGAGDDRVQRQGPGHGRKELMVRVGRRQALDRVEQ